MNIVNISFVVYFACVKCLLSFRARQYVREKSSLGILVFLLAAGCRPRLSSSPDGAAGIR